MSFIRSIIAGTTWTSSSVV